MPLIFHGFISKHNTHPSHLLNHSLSIFNTTTLNSSFLHSCFLPKTVVPVFIFLVFCVEKEKNFPERCFLCGEETGKYFLLSQGENNKKEN